MIKANVRSNSDPHTNIHSKETPRWPYNLSWKLNEIPVWWPSSFSSCLLHERFTWHPRAELELLNLVKCLVRFRQLSPPWSGQTSEQSGILILECHSEGLWAIGFTTFLDPYHARGRTSSAAFLANAQCLNTIHFTIEKWFLTSIRLINRSYDIDLR